MIRTAYALQANWKITLLVVLLLPVLLRLGFWQLDRADEKRELQQLYSERQSQPPVELTALLELPAERLAYRSVRVSGKYLPDPIFLLDNQILHGNVGYQVLQVFEPENGPPNLLVNRGWLAGLPDRSLPQLPAVLEPGSLIANIHVPLGSPVLLTEDRWSNGAIRVIQSVDMDKIRGALNEPVFPYELRLQPGEYGSLSIDWPIVNTRVEKHLGYAFQWFAMSAALIFCWIVLMVRGSRSTSNAKQ